jgi:hypothetical protein
MSYSSITMETQQKSINSVLTQALMHAHLKYNSNKKKITTKCENLALEIKNIWKLNNIYICIP